MDGVRQSADRQDEPLRDSADPRPAGADCAGAGSLPLFRQDFARYEFEEELGSGGVGVVTSGFDPNLRRRVAIKRLHARLQDDPRERSRFVREARIMAQIEHPNVVPVHEIGVGDDGSPYFSMKRVSGVTLEEVLRGLKYNRSEIVRHYSRGALLDILMHVCQAVAFAHSRGVIHRDLKPGNILLGPFGEVMVMDWGLARRIDGREELAGEPETNPGEAGTTAPRTDCATLEGAIAGTPEYMAPEQAQGRLSQLDERSDLYSLGAILYEILTLERTVSGLTAREVLTEVIEQVVVPPRRLPLRRRTDLHRPARSRVPRELDAICMKALAKRKEDRYASVSELAEDIEAYLHGFAVKAFPEPLLRRAWKGCLRHRVISSSVAAGLAVLLLGAGGLAFSRSVRYDTLVREADTHRIAGTRLFEEKAALFERLDRLESARTGLTPSEEETALAAELERLHGISEAEYTTAMVLYARARELLRRPPLREPAREIMINRIDYALRTRRHGEALQWVGVVKRFFGEDLAGMDPGIRAEILERLERVRGDGWLEVTTRPAGAAVVLAAFEPAADGALRPGPGRTLGATPLRGVRLPMGSYRLTLQTEGRPDVHCPVKIDHSERESLDVYLPRRIPAGMVYVPGGAFYVGGQYARYSRLREVTLPAFFMREREVTVGEYLEFWRAPDGAHGDREAMSCIRLDRDDRRFLDGWDAEGRLRDPLQENLPVVGITQAAAARYCEWLGRRLGRVVRLPTADEWEKAARGTDGRTYPWGNDFVPSFAFTLENTAARERCGFWAPTGSFPEDCSVYGAFDMAGNVREWTASLFPDESRFLQIKGGSAAMPRRFAVCAYASDTPTVPSDVGFRYVMEVEEEKELAGPR